MDLNDFSAYEPAGNTSDNYVMPDAYTSDGYKGESGTFLDSMGNIFNSAGKLLTGGSGTGAQLASLAGLAGLAGAFGGGGGSGGFAGYRGGIPKYTASRKQYAVPTDGQVINYRPSDAEISN